MKVLIRTIILVLFLICCCGTAIADNLYIFTADWCGACQNLKSFLENDNDVPKWFDISMINIDEFPEIAKAYNIKTVPTTVIIRDEKEIGRITGYNRSYKRKLKHQIENK